MEKKIEIGKNGKVKIKWNLSPIDYTKEKEKNIKALFGEKYGISPSNITIEKNFKKLSANGDTALNAENIKDITDVNFHHKLYKQYITENEIKDYDWDAIVSIDSMINNQINFDKYEKGKRYTIKWLDWDNFLSYGKNNHFDFTQLHGLVLLNGEPANKSGKSTFAYDLLHFLFFGKTHSGKADDELGQLFNIHLQNETELKVEGCINIDGTDYIIKRTLKRAGKSKKELRSATQKIEYYKINEVGEQEELVDVDNLQEASSTATNKVIKEAIGDENDFDLIISANMKDLDELISLKKTDRGRLLSRWIGLSCLEDKNTIARETWNKKISVGRYCDIYNRETLNSEISSLKEKNKSNNEEIEEKKKKVTECEKNIDRYNNDITRYASEKKQIDNSVNPNINVTTLETKIENIIKTGKENSALKANLEKQVNKITDYEYSEEDYKTLVSKKETLIYNISKIKTNIENLKNSNKQLKTSEFCPTCGKRFDGIDNTKHIEENKTKIKELIDEGIKLNTEKEEVISKIEKIEVKKENYKTKNQLELKISALETKIVNLRLELKETKEIIKKFNDNKEAIKTNSDIDAKINTLKETVKTEDNIKNRLNSEIVSLEKDTETNKKNITEKESIIVKINNEEKIEKDWKLYLRLIGKDGISKIVLRNTLPIINAQMDNLLNDVADFTVEVIMNDKNEVDFIMERDGAKCKLNAASGFERTVASLALRVVLGNMSMLSRPPFILLDEILGGVAKENYDAVKKLYDKIIPYFSFVLHITHLNDILDWHSQVITIKKENNISSIKSVL